MLRLRREREIVTNRQEYTQASSSTVTALDAYILALEQKYPGRPELTAQVMRLSEYRFQLQNDQLRAADNSEKLRQAIAELTQANSWIQQEITASKEFQQKVEAAAEIADIIQRGIGFALG